MLQTKDLTVRFGGHVAVNAVSCTFQPGTLTAIVGPNGAGKTTYFNLISGQVKATAGEVLLNGSSLAGMSPSARTRAGLGRAFQLTNLFPNLSVLENVRLAVQAARAGPHLRGLNLWTVWSDHKALTQLAEEVLEAVSMLEKRHTPVEIPGAVHGSKVSYRFACRLGLEFCPAVKTRTTNHSATKVPTAPAPVDASLLEKLFDRATDVAFFPGAAGRSRRH